MQTDATVPAGLGTTDGPLGAAHDLLLLDLDGVVYAGPHALPGVPERLARCREAGSALGFVTNNASRPPAAVAAHLRELGIDAGDDDVVTSAQAAARLVADRVPAGSRVLVVGGEGLVAALAEHDLQAVWSADDDPAAVVQGFHRSVGWELLAEGAYALATGVPWVASNRDQTVPTDRGRAPGVGTLVDALRVTSGREPVVAGKPEPALFDECTRRLSGRTPLVVGDRLDTDVAGASRSGLPSLLVLTGVSSLTEACAAQGDDRADYVSPDLQGLLLPHPPVETGDGWARCAGWRAEVDDDRIALGPDDGADDDAGGDSEDDSEDAAPAALAAVRAVVAACWGHADSSGGALDVGPAVERLRAITNVTDEET